MRLSIIIPAYKVAAYIEKCIRSLQNQDLAQSDYEIIVTNDGSPDDCQTIVENLQSEFTNIVLLNQENQGVSMARNNGIAIAKGKYILPIDPDDYVLPNTINQLLFNAEEKKLDILYLGFEIFDTEGKSIWKTNYQTQEQQVFSGVEGYFASRGSNVKDPDRSWAILYRKELLDNFSISYPKNVPFLEDGLFIGKVLSVAKKVGFSNTGFYQRTTRMGSATNSDLFYTKKSIEGFKYAILDVLEFRSKFNASIISNGLLNHIHAKFFLHLLAPSTLSFNYSEFGNIVKTIKKENLFVQDKEGLSNVNKRLIQVYELSPFLFYIYYPILLKKRNKKLK